MINIGNKKLKTLHRGGDLVTRVYKGDELVYQDLEALYSFKFTIDTRLTNNGALTSTDKHFSINRQYTYIGNKDQTPRTEIKIDWGDGTYDISSVNHYLLTHEYSASGEYQITISPTVFRGGAPIPGWLSGIILGGDSYGRCVKHLDGHLPENSYQLRIGYNSDQIVGGYCVSFRQMFSHFFNLETAPDHFFDNISITHNTSHPSVSNMFLNTFSDCGRNTNLNVFDFATPLIEDFIVAADLSECTDFSSMFAGTFSDTCQNSSHATIPQGLFDHLDTSSGTNFSNMFNNTFASALQNAPDANIPAGLFDHIDTSNATNLSGMFYNTFYSSCRHSTVANIPTGLFDTIDTSNATNLSSMFNSIFSGFGTDSTVFTIPQGLFDNVDLTNCTNITSMFTAAFADCGKKSTVWSIPEDLFDTLDLTNITSVEGLFTYTFSNMGSETCRGAFPYHLFDNLDTSNVINFANLFYGTFRQSYFDSSITTLPAFFQNISTANGVNFSHTFAALFQNIHFASTVTIPSDLFDTVVTTNGTNFEGMFYDAFSFVHATSIPAGLFAHIDTSNGTNFRQMFSTTFNQFNSDSTQATIPATLFNFLDTRKGTNFIEMFSRTFETFDPRHPSSIPANLFSAVDTSSGTQFDSMFNSTFASFCAWQNGGMTIPNTLFDNIDTTNATSMEGMFVMVFDSVYPTQYPEGIFRNIKVLPNATRVFNAAFRCYPGGNISTVNTFAPEMKDVFDGMSDFSWITAANAAQKVNEMFSKNPYLTDGTIGAASTILQHFNFDPASDTNMFANRTNLTDYATINANWK